MKNVICKNNQGLYNAVVIILKVQIHIIIVNN